MLLSLGLQESHTLPHADTQRGNHHEMRCAVLAEGAGHATVDKGEKQRQGRERTHHLQA